MSQYINLYPQLGLGQRDWLDGTKLLQWLGIALLLVLALGAIDFYRYTISHRQAEQAAAQLASIRAEFDRLQATRQQLGSGATLQQAVQALEREGERKQALLDRLGSADGALGGGVARYLVGLGQRPPRDLWFTQIDVLDSGASIVLGGRAVTPDAVPRYLQRLRDDPAFSGQRFSLLQIAAAEAQDELDFLIRSRREPM
jgi:MSHA biogenesis protein MshI